MYNKLIELGNLTETITNGEPIKTWTWTESYAKVESVRQSEVYQAALTNLAPEIVFRMPAWNFDNEERIRYESKIYEIVRTYVKDRTIEIVCSALGGDV